MKSLIALATLALVSTTSLSSPAQAAPKQTAAVSDAALVRTLPGFTNGEATVNGVRLHYVVGGKGSPVVLLPGWPQTWWAFHKIMPALARDHRVISVDLRGMGSSDKPADGYDKKTMARDILELVRQLGHDKVDLVGHDIGAQVAFSFAANHPEATRKLVLLDVPHPDAQLATWPLLPAVGTFGDKIDEAHPFAWWFAFHQVKGLPEQILEGRQHLEQEWFFRYLLKDESAIDARDRAVYAAAYASREAIRAGNAWYQAFPQDIVDDGSYGKLTMPVLGLGGPGFGWLKATLSGKATDLRVIKVEGSGHFIAEEKPEATLGYLADFLK
ncbi:alpha/beta hydrolase fold having protein [Cystobacter fuscus DSM 2262]|uniref:Alpha/beta hydrolase fold having protein n=1 Tax=Cystobacter fuscus (strain ATCC 25194 / DSM 2262 / NBRC 100088 / M29) TaxID=1242864 RepID=S9QGQ6_CYSF2|nr:alpha/beta hydrolase [Cystobacter fuscus]EPX55563.1 alpha/beta hydrolase fold having protein [Cystobacter fuscus DSM 2262]